MAKIQATKPRHSEEWEIFVGELTKGLRYALRASVHSYRNKTYFSVRCYERTAENQLKRTYKGWTLEITHVSDLIDLIKDVRRLARKKGLLQNGGRR